MKLAVAMVVGLSGCGQSFVFGVGGSFAATDGMVTIDGKPITTTLGDGNFTFTYEDNSASDYAAAKQDVRVAIVFLDGDTTLATATLMPGQCDFALPVAPTITGETQQIGLLGSSVVILGGVCADDHGDQYRFTNP